MESRESQANKALCTELQWVVSDRIMVGWKDGRTGEGRFLGRLSSHNRKAEFSLMLGHTPNDKNAFLLMFHLPLRAHASSASRPKDLFLVVPVDAFAADAPLTTALTPAKEMPDPVGQAIKTAGLGGSADVLHVRFNLKEPGYVIMPREKVKKPVVGTPRDLLLSLRSLSQATHINGYLKRNTYSQVALNNFGEAVLQGDAATPALRLKAMYQGHGGKKDAWEIFQLGDNETANPSLNPLAFKAAELDREGSAPPPYEEAVRTPTPQPERAKQPKTPETQVRDSVSVVEETPPAEACDANNYSRKRNFSDTEITPERPDTLTAKKSSKSLPPPPARGPTPNDDEDDPVTSIFPPSPPRRAHSSPAAPTTLVATSQPTAQPAAEPTTTIDIPHSSSAPLSSPRLHPLPPTHPDVSTATADATTDALLCETASWLQDAWAVSPRAHEQLRRPLLALGCHARRAAVRDFDAAKGWCTALLYVRIAPAAAANQEDVAARGSGGVEREVAALVAWANGRVFRGAESVLRAETRALGEAAAAAVVGGGRRKEEGEAAWAAFERQKALWVASVFVCFGAEEDVEVVAEGGREV